MTTVEKILSANDTGETGGHQAGLLVPRQPAMLRFFPHLDKSAYNPRCVIDVTDEGGVEWTFNYIYYNNSLLTDTGTRNEYRITGMTAFIRQYRLKTGDTLTFEHVGERRYLICCRRKDTVETAQDGRKVLRLSGNWAVFDVEGS